jgi:hypothetical protein
MDSEGPFGDGAEIGVGFSDVAILVVSLLGFCFLASTIYSLILLKVQSREEFDKTEQEALNYNDQLDLADVATLTRAQRRARAKHIMKRQRRLMAPPLPLDDNDNEEQDEQEPPLHPEEHFSHTMSRKERQKSAKVAELKERRLFQDQRQQLQHDAQETAKKEKKERERIEAERMEQEKELRRNNTLLYEKTQQTKYNTFLVSRDDDNEETTLTMSVREFCAHVQQNKVVSVDDLADRFHIPSAQVVERIQELVDTCRLDGVVDGDWFIHISSDEMTRVATLIMKQKQVTIQEVAKSTLFVSV